MPVPYVFGNATTAIPLTNLDANFNTPVTIGNTTVGLGNTVTALGNVTLNNVTITSGSINAAISHAYATANAVVYSNSSSIGTTSTALTFDGTNLGIGVTSPTSKLDLSAGSGSSVNAIRVRSLSGNSNGFNIITDSTTDNIYLNNYYTAAMLFGTANTERMRITSGGNVGIGTNNPLNPLAVVGGNAGNMLVDNGGQQYTQLLLQRNSTTNTGGDILIDGTNSIMYLRGLLAGRISIGTSSSAGSPVERLSINNTGTISLQGAATNTTGVGISFPATQVPSSDANTLDDYEEGTWTPTASAASGSITSYTSGGNYTKVGRFIYLTGYVSLTNVGTASSTFTLGGLPFNTYDAGNNTERPCVAVSREDANTGIIYTVFLNRGATNGIMTTLTNGTIAWTNGYRYTFSLYYQVA